MEGARHEIARDQSVFRETFQRRDNGVFWRTIEKASNAQFSRVHRRRITQAVRWYRDVAKRQVLVLERFKTARKKIAEIGDASRILTGQLTELRALARTEFGEGAEGMPIENFGPVNDVIAELNKRLDKRPDSNTDGLRDIRRMTVVLNREAARLLDLWDSVFALPRRGRGNPRNVPLTQFIVTTGKIYFDACQRIPKANRATGKDHGYDGPFVRFAFALRKAIPLEARPHVHSDLALGCAIARALSGFEVRIANNDFYIPGLLEEDAVRLRSTQDNVAGMSHTANPHDGTEL